MKRRDFLKTTALAGAGLPLLGLTSCGDGKKGRGPKRTPEELGMFSFVDMAPDGKPLKAALIGCGSRGTGVVRDLPKAGPNVELVAMVDIFQDRMDTSRKTLAEEYDIVVPDENCFLGFNAYKKVLEMDEIDLVLLTTPTHFRPEHFKAAVEAGKHVFMEKPCAVDPTGIRTVIAAGKAAEAKGLTVITGTQRRHRSDYWEAYVEVQNGIIGEVLGASAHWDQGAVWRKNRRPGWSDMEYCMRNWYSTVWLSGDHILDQAIHNIDIVTWFTGMLPEHAVGFGGRAQRLTGDVYDFFAVDYYYPGNKRMLATARQIDGCDNNVSEQIVGSDGVALLNDRNDITIVDHDGNLLWRYDYENKPVRGAIRQELVHLVESIRLGKGLNQAQDLAYSTLVAILGREAAYTGLPITWDEIMASPLRYGPETYEFGPLPFFKDDVVAKPGRPPGASL